MAVDGAVPLAPVPLDVPVTARQSNRADNPKGDVITA
jgi:hypothetical protein